MDLKEIQKCLAEHKQREIEREGKNVAVKQFIEPRGILSYQDAVDSANCSCVTTPLQNKKYKITFQYHYDISPDRKITRTEEVFAGSLQEVYDKLKNKYPNAVLNIELPEINLQKQTGSKMYIHMEPSGDPLAFTLEPLCDDIAIRIRDTHGNSNILMVINHSGSLGRCSLDSNFRKHFKTNINDKIEEG